jgi:two-component system cell cycle sensor histidine kinase/response regulator CckA
MNGEAIRVLLVEDNPGDARLVRETLAEVESPQFELTHVERLSQARQRLADERFDIVLLDLVLPDKPRMGSLIEIHDQASRVPIVVLTGLDDETMASWTLEEGAQDYLIKGQTDPESLVRTIRHAIKRHRTQAGKLRSAPARFA